MFPASLQQQQQTLLVPLFLRVLNNVEYLYPKKKKTALFFFHRGPLQPLLLRSPSVPGLSRVLHLSW